MFDIFYSGVKPNLFAHEQPADSIQHARTLSRTRSFWWVNYLTDYTGFDFLFEPVPWQAEYTHAWPSQWQRDSGTYLIPIAGTEQIYYNTNVTLTRLSTLDNWTVPDACDTDAFDFSWHPDYSEPDYVYQFGTQHQRTGGPQYIRNTDNKNNNAGIKFVDQIRAKIKSGSTPIIEIDHLDGNVGQIKDTVRTVRYFDNYLDTLTRIANNTELEHIWICSSICDYRDFDFSWHPEQWQATMLHVFASDDTKFGDTFYMHVPSFRARISQFELLDWYDINFVVTSVPRRPIPVIKHTHNTQVEAVKNNNWAGPLSIFTTQDNIIIKDIPAVSLWREKTKTIVPLSLGASTVIIPKAAVPYIKTQLYDYPYIDRTQRGLYSDQLCDIIFISYDEPAAEVNWNIIKDKFSRAKRVHGINGMETALEAAADTAETPWYYAVFAKTKIHESFDFTFVPDYMQQPKHYIFNSKNTVNGLEYGHMGIILYNSDGIRKLNQTKDFGLDYTLSFSHESVPILSCYGSFDQTPYHTWRTAFRETAKLAYFESQQSTVEGRYRLQIWQNTATGPYADWCLKGAADGVKFFEDSNQQLSTIKQNFRWEWLREFFVTRYGELD